jgi:hypothetical protein
MENSNIDIENPIFRQGTFSAPHMTRIRELGRSSHSVLDLYHYKTYEVARKKLQADHENSIVMKKMFDELQKCVSLYLIKIFKVDLNEHRELLIIMQYMDCLSLDSMLDKVNCIPINMLGACVVSV